MRRGTNGARLHCQRSLVRLGACLVIASIWVGASSASETRKPADAVITPKASSSRGFSENLLGAVRRVDGVAFAVGGVEGTATLLSTSGQPIRFGKAPNIGFSIDPSYPRFNSLTLLGGSWPTHDDVVVDITTATKRGIKVGQQIRVASHGVVRRLRVSGIIRYGAIASLGGATLAGFNLRTGQQIFFKVGKLDSIRVAAEQGVSTKELVKRLRRVLPTSVTVRAPLGPEG